MKHTVVLGLVFVLVTQVVSAVASAAQFTRPDSRVVALEDLNNRGVTAANSLYEGYSPFYAGGYATVFDDFRDGDTGLRPINPEVQYVVLSSGMFGRFQAADGYSEEKAFYQVIDRDYELVVEYSPQRSDFSVPFNDVRLLRAVESLGQTVQGSSTGPTIRVFSVPEIPLSTRDHAG